MMNPHEKNVALAANQTKLVLSHEQMTAVCNVLWNHYAMIDPSSSQADFTTMKASSLQDEKIVQSVYESLCGCLMAMDASTKAQA